MDVCVIFDFRVHVSCDPSHRAHLYGNLSDVKPESDVEVGNHGFSRRSELGTAGASGRTWTRSSNVTGE